MEELLQTIDFPSQTDRPYFFTSYVSTIDGKIFVNRPGYWPIGSRNDYNYFTFLRAHADVIIEGKNTALRFAKHTIDTIHREDFINYRKQIGKTEQIKHVVVTTNPDESLLNALQNSYDFRPTILTTQEAVSSNDLAEMVTVGADEGKVAISQIVDYLFNNRLKLVFLDTGPNMFMSFMQKELVDEIFLTLAPKIFGNLDNDAMTLGETALFTPEFVPEFDLLQTKQVNQEVFLRYRKNTRKPFDIL